MAHTRRMWQDKPRLCSSVYTHLALRKKSWLGEIEGACHVKAEEDDKYEFVTRKALRRAPRVFKRETVSGATMPRIVPSCMDAGARLPTRKLSE